MVYMSPPADLTADPSSLFKGLRRDLVAELFLSQDSTTRVDVAPRREISTHNETGGAWRLSDSSGRFGFAATNDASFNGLLEARAIAESALSLGTSSTAHPFATNRGAPDPSKSRQCRIVEPLSLLGMGVAEVCPGRTGTSTVAVRAETHLSQRWLTTSRGGSRSWSTHATTWIVKCADAFPARQELTYPCGRERQALLDALRLLTKAGGSPVGLDHYSGPVLFEPLATAQLLSVIGNGLTRAGSMLPMFVRAAQPQVRKGLLLVDKTDEDACWYNPRHDDVGEPRRARLVLLGDEGTGAHTRARAVGRAKRSSYTALPAEQSCDLQLMWPSSPTVSATLSELDSAVRVDQFVDLEGSGSIVSGRFTARALTRVVTHGRVGPAGLATIRGDAGSMLTKLVAIDLEQHAFPTLGTRGARCLVSGFEAFGGLRNERELEDV